MAYQATFKRYELKYLLSPKDKAAVLRAMEGHMKLDAYGRDTIRNIYFDTDNFRLIRHSLEKPVYKEKLRLRSYHLVTPEDTIFVELKKKYNSVVYKRRLTLPEGVTMDCFRQGLPLPVNSQIGNEVEYFRSHYRTLQPKVFLSYEREAFFALDGSDFRVTFDENILYREEDLSLCSEAYGKAILPQGKTLMEIKTSGGMPLWMTEVLGRQGLYKASFSKYGAAYQEMLAAWLKNLGGTRYA